MHEHTERLPRLDQALHDQGISWRLPPVVEALQARRSMPCNAAGFLRASAEAQPRCGVTLDGVKRLVQDTRVAREAGTRRMPGRWEPTHGERQDHPSDLPGSDSSDVRRHKTT